MKTTKILTKAVCASALMLPLTMPVAAHAQTDTPPVVMSAVPAAEYQEAYVQSTPGLRYNGCLQTNTRYSFALNAEVQLTGAYSGYFDARHEGEYAVSFSSAAINGAQPSTIPTIVSFFTPATATDEQYNFFIDLVGISRNPSESGGPPADDTSFVVLVPCVTDAAAQPSATPIPTATPAPAANPTQVVTAFLEAARQGPAAGYAPYLASTLEQQVVSGELPLIALLGSTAAYDTFTILGEGSDAAGRAIVLADLGGQQRGFHLVQENGAWQIERIVLSETGVAALTPGETVAGFLNTVQQNPASPVVNAYGYMSFNERISNETAFGVLGIQSVYRSFSIDSTTVNGQGGATVIATLNFDTGSIKRMFQLGLQPVWGITNVEGHEAQPAPSSAPVTGNTISFKLNVNGEPCNNATYWGYVGLIQSDVISVQLTDADGDSVYTGSTPPLNDGTEAVVQLVQGTGVVSTPLTGNVPGEPSRVIADFGTQQPGGFKYRVLNNDFLAEASVNSCAAAPSATPSATAKPSATPAPSATAKPSATTKPSATAAATPAPSTAPTKLPDTGAVDTMLGGLLAAGAALAASGGYLLRRRAR